MNSNIKRGFIIITHTLIRIIIICDERYKDILGENFFKKNAICNYLDNYTLNSIWLIKEYKDKNVTLIINLCMELYLYLRRRVQNLRFQPQSM